jgi:hypothetical protein
MSLMGQNPNLPRHNSIYEDRQTLPDLRWFWSITVYVNPKQWCVRRRPNGTGGTI